MILIYYFVNLSFGLILMLPFRFVLGSFIGSSLMGERLAGKLDMDFLFEFLQNNVAGLASIKALILTIPVLYWLFSLFLSGGVLSVFASGEKYNAQLFWSGAAKYFGRFLRLCLWCIPVVALLFCLPFIWNGIQRLIFGKDPFEYVKYYGAWIKVGLRCLSILLIYLAFDYSCIHVVLSDERKMRKSLLTGIKFSFSKFLNTFGLSLLLFIGGAVALVIYNPLTDLLHAPLTVIILLLFLLQQFYMLFRMMLKLMKFSSQLELYRFLSD